MSDNTNTATRQTTLAQYLEKTDALENLNISLADMAKKMLPLKFDSILSEHKKFIFTSGLRDEIFIRCTHNKQALQTFWNRPLLLDEKQALQRLIWQLTEPYLHEQYDQVISCRKFGDKILGLKNVYPVIQNDERGACVQRLINLCVLTKKQQEALRNMNTVPKDSFTSLIFSPLAWISPRSKAHLNQEIFFDFLIFELNGILLKKSVKTLLDLDAFLEKLAVTQQFTINAESYPVLYQLVSNSMAEISDCFKISAIGLNELLSIKLSECKDTWRKLMGEHDCYTAEAIEKWLSPSLPGISPILIKEFSKAIFDLCPEQQFSAHHAFIF